MAGGPGFEPRLTESESSFCTDFVAVLLELPGVDVAPGGEPHVDAVMSSKILRSVRRLFCPFDRGLALRYFIVFFDDRMLGTPSGSPLLVERPMTLLI